MLGAVLFPSVAFAQSYSSSASATVSPTATAHPAATASASSATASATASASALPVTGGPVSLMALAPLVLLVGSGILAFRVILRRICARDVDDEDTLDGGDGTDKCVGDPLDTYITCEVRNSLITE
jgi:hypothetical protein